MNTHFTEQFLIGIVLVLTAAAGNELAITHDTGEDNANCARI